MLLGKLRGRGKCPGNSSVLALRSALGTQAREKGDPVEKAGDGCTCAPHSAGGVGGGCGAASVIPEVRVPAD